MLPKTNYLSNLTALRGIAAILVAIFHFEMAVARFIPASSTQFFEKSYLMVDLFFIMSGFIMLHVYGESFSINVSGNNYRKFMVARFARIYPLHFFSLSLLILITFYGYPPSAYPNPMEFNASIPTNYLLLHSYYIHRIYTWNIPSWSISAEWLAYLLFPALALILKRLKVQALIVYIIVIILSYYSIMYLLPRKNPLYPLIPVPHNINSTYDYGFLRGVAGFMTGMLMYRLYLWHTIQQLLSKDLTALIIIILLIAGLHYAINDAFIVILFSACVPAFAANEGYFKRICNTQIAQYFGDISYSIYLMQIFFQDPFSKGFRLSGVTGYGRGKMNIDFLPGIVYCSIYLALLIITAGITYRFIEKPSRKFINKYWSSEATLSK